MRYPGSAWTDSSHPLPTKQTRTASGLSVQGRVVIAPADLNQTRFCISGRVPISMRSVIQDPLGLDEVGSYPLLAKQIGTTSILST